MTIEGKMLANRLDELSSLNDAVQVAENELATVRDAGAPKATVADFKNRRDHAAMLRDRVKKEAEFLRTLTEMHAVTLSGR